MLLYWHVPDFLERLEPKLYFQSLKGANTQKKSTGECALPKYKLAVWAGGWKEICNEGHSAVVTIHTKHKKKIE